MGTRNLFWFSHKNIGAEALGPSFAAFPGTLLGVILEVKQLGFKPAFVWDSGAIGAGYTTIGAHYIIAAAGLLYCAFYE